MNIAILHTGLRGDEKLLLDAIKTRKLNYELIDIRTALLDPEDLSFWKKYDVILERCISTVRGNAAIEFLSNSNLPVLNNKEVMNICNDKFQTSTVLEINNVPTAKSILVFDEATAKTAVEKLGGFPVVVKSRNGSWGRLIAKISDMEALEAIIDHKSYMGPEHSAILLQEYVKKPGRDIRAFVINHKCICAIFRSSEHWITNTARGGKATNCPVIKDLAKICEKASKSVGGGILAMDLFESKRGLIINEINHTMEFKNSETPTKISISGAVIDYCVEYAKSFVIDSRMDPA